MYTYLLGGAERYLGDLYQHLDRDRFDITLFLVPWPALVEFLGVPEADRGAVVALPVTEQGMRVAPSSSVTGLGQHGEELGAEPRSTVIGRALRNLTPDGLARSLIANPVKLSWWRGTVGRLGRMLRENPVDVLHVVNGGYPGAVTGQAAMVAARHEGVHGRMMTVCSTAGPRPARRPVERHIDRAVAASTQVFVVPAGRPGQALLDRGIPPSTLQTIPWGVDAPKAGTDRLADQRSARMSLGLPLEAPIFGTLANFTPAKGHAIVLEAARMLRSDFPAVRVVLAGAGSEQAAMRELAAEIGMADSAIFPGRIDDPYLLARALDVFVLASDIEGLPYVILEALSQGTPIVSTDVGGISEVVVPGRNGFLVPVRDPGAVATAVARVLNDRDLAEAMRHAAGEIYDARFTVTAMVEAHEALYTELLERRA